MLTNPSNKTKGIAAHIRINHAHILDALFSITRTHAAEPQHEGKTVTHWIKLYTIGFTDEELAKNGGRIKEDGDRLRKEMANRTQAREALTKIGAPAVPYIIAWIKSADAIAQERKNVAKIQTAETAGAQLIPVWLTPDSMRFRGMEVLKHFGPTAKEALPVFLDALNTEHQSLQLTACEAINSLGAEGQAALPFLTAKLASPQRTTRAFVATAISGVLRSTPDKAAQQAVLQQLILVLKDDFPPVRHNAATAIGMFGPDGRSAVPALIDSLKADNAQAAAALGSIGPDAKGAVPTLLELAIGTDPYLRRCAKDALKRIDPEALKKLEEPAKNL